MSEPIDAYPPVDARALARALDAVLMGFQVIGFDWTYIYVNPAAARHGRSSPDALVGRTMFEAYPGIDRQEPLMTILRQAMTARTGQVLEHEFSFPDGQRRWFHIRVEPVPEGICVYSVDIHDRKQRELVMERRLAELERPPRPLWQRMWSGLAARARPRGRRDHAVGAQSRSARSD